MKKRISLSTLFFYGCLFMYSQNPVNALYKDEPDGKSVSYYSKNQVQTECEVVKGNIKGARITYYKNGKIFVKEQFDKGKYFGRNFMLTKDGDTSWVETYKYDTLIYSKNFEYNHGKLQSTSSVWYAPDSDTSTAYADKLKYVVQANATSLLLDLNRLEQIYSNHGIYQEYYKSGQMKLQAHTRKVFYNGSYIQNYENGMKEIEAIYVDGKLNGKYKEYYENGSVKIKATYKDDKLEGDYFEYDKSGTERKMSYKNGVPVL